MKSLIRIFLFLTLIQLSFSCVPKKNLTEPKTVIMPLSEKTSLREGSLVYGLPLTVVDVFVEVERIIERSGPYARFAGEMLGLTDVITQEGEYWSIMGITLRTHEELDPSEFYVIETNTLFETNILSLKKAGLILDLNPQLFDIYSIQEGMITGKEADLESLRISDLGADEYYLSESDTAYKIVTFDTEFVRIPYLVEKKQMLTMEQLAERAAIRLMEMRDGKHLILTGEANVFPQSEASIKEMNRLETEYTELFTGKTWKETKTFTYQLIPRSEMIGTQVTLFKFSELTGPESAAEETGTPVIIEFLPELKTKDLVLIEREPADPADPEYDKLFYRVPDVVNMKISYGDEILNSSRRMIYQFGEVVQLPANYIIGK
jgi:hypothetical protein